MPWPPTRPKSPRRLPAFAAAVSAIAALSPHWSSADTTASWLSEVSGSWATPSRWSTTPNYPQNGSPSGSAYDAFVSATGSTAFTLTLNSNIAINSLKLTSPTATLNQNSGTLTAGSITLSAGTYTLSSGVIAGGTLNLAGGAFTVQNGTLDNVNITGGDLHVGAEGSLYVQNGISVADQNIDIGFNSAIPSNLYFDGPTLTVNNLNIIPAGWAYIYSNGPTASSSGTLTLGSNVTIHGGADFENYQPYDTLVSNGTISADSAYATHIDLYNFINNGTVQATNGDIAYINDSYWTNNGTINAASNSVIYLEGGENAPSAGTLETASTGTIYLDGFMSGSTMNVGGGNIWVYDETLANCTITGGDLKLGKYGSLTIQNGITIADHNLDLTDGGNNATPNYLYFDGSSQSVNNLNITPGGYAYIYASGPSSSGAQTLTFGSGVTVHGGAQFDNFNTGDSLINNGTINADSGAYATSINLTNFTNNGTVEASSGGTLFINSTKWASPGPLTTSGTGEVVLGGECTGGTINIAGSNVFVQGATLSDASVIGGDLQVSGGSYVDIQNGISIADHNLDLGYNGNPSIAYFDGPSQSLTNLNITPAGTAYIFASGANSSGPQTLTLGSGVTVHGGAQFYDYFPGDTLVNNGTIDADSGTYATTIGVENFINNGVAEATNGGILYVTTPNWINAGTISAFTHGTVYLIGTGSGANNGSGIGTITTDATGTVYLDSTSTVGLIGGSGSLLIGSGVTLSVVNGLTQGPINSGGTLNASGGSSDNVGPIDGAGTLSITGTAALTAIHIRQAVLVIGPANTVTIADSASPGTSAATSILTDLYDSGTLDLKNNDLIITDTTQFQAVESAIASSYDRSKWDAPGLTSSSARANPGTYGLGYATATEAGTTTFDGQAVSSGEILVKYTLLGDTQLRGTVGIGDYDTVVSNYGKPEDWSGGDFHYGGVVGIGDYDAIITNYGAHASGNIVIGPSLSRSLSSDLAKTDLKLEVNTTTGDVYVLATASAAFSGYTISDPSAHLLGGSASPDPDKLLSVSANAGGNTNIYETSGTSVNWFKITETASQVAEGQQQNGFATHSSRDDTINIPAGGTIDFGDIYNTAAGVQDISFDFAEAGTTPTSGPTYYGAEVDYITSTTPEPGSASLFAVAAVGALVRRRRREHPAR
jgi:MYXO-CTERM domain-containing protein